MNDALSTDHKRQDRHCRWDALSLSSNPEHGSGVGSVIHSSGQLMSEWPLRSLLELAALPTAVACFRLHAKHLVWEWGLEKLADDVELVVSELATNALQATVAMEQSGRSRRFVTVPCVELRLFTDGQQMLIEVWDNIPQLPESLGPEADGIPALDDESGRGLFLVDTLSQKWGHYSTPTGILHSVAAATEGAPATAFSQSRNSRTMGKVVWAVLA